MHIKLTCGVLLGEGKEVGERKGKERERKRVRKGLLGIEREKGKKERDVEK